MQAAQASLLPDGRRLHLHHGPIDLIVEAFGAPEEVRQAYLQAKERFQTILEELVEELALLRAPLGPDLPLLEGKVAREMCAAAAAQHRPAFVTPMIAVAGAVADEILAALVAGRQLERAYVNNGGDAAFHLTKDSRLTSAIFATAAKVTLTAEAPARGLATSGWRGRSWSLGIADSVTVLAETAAKADVAATLIANAVDLPGHALIERAPAASLDPDCELGELPVTLSVGALTRGEARAALYGGLKAAEPLRRQGLILGAALFLQQEAAFSPPELFETSIRLSASASSPAGQSLKSR